MSVLAPKPIQRADANPSFERLLDSEEAASLLKIHPKTLQKMARSGEIAEALGRQLMAFARSGFEPPPNNQMRRRGTSFLTRLGYLVRLNWRECGGHHSREKQP